MDITYTEEQEATRKMVRDFAKKELAPGAEERDRTGKFDSALYRRLGELGICGMRCPEEYGGTDADFLSYCLALEEIGRVDLSLSWTLFVGTGIAGMILGLGTEEQIEMWKDRWVIPVIKGEALGASAITEPGAGSDTGGIQTTGVPDGDEWVINGTKTMITNAGLDICNVISVVCLTDRDRRQFDTILVPIGTPGCTVMPAFRKMGLRSSSTNEIVFEDCRVPAINVVGERGTGRTRTVMGFAGARVCLASTAIGLHQACLDLSLNYAKTRIAFGRPIAEFQHIQAMLVDMALDLELSRMIRDKAAILIDQRKPHMREAAMAKYFCCESAVKAAHYAVQVHGALGYMDECPVSRYYRDIRVATIADGTTEIQKYIIARELGIRHSLYRV